MNGAPQDQSASAVFQGERALQYVAVQMEFGPRPTGSEALRQSGDYILQELERLGWRTSQHAFQLENADPPVPVRNLVAELGEGPDPAILLAAHYDTRLLADEDPDPHLRNQPVPGANDGGSGVGVLLELARVLGQHHRLYRPLRLVFFDAEDNGRLQPFSGHGDPRYNGWILGSQRYAADADLSQIELMILVDLVGDLNQSLPRERFSQDGAPQLAREVWDLALEMGYGRQFVRFIRTGIIDDHLPFLDRGIPAVDIIDLDYPHWHTTGDTLDKVSAESLQRVGRLLQEFLIRRGAVDRAPLIRDRPLRASPPRRKPRN
ncbi:MAG TPA: M28 family peptidase [Acidobacteriota bacterium]|nr:M28 family peptidase [Acidobacteriota bacterium]